MSNSHDTSTERAYKAELINDASIDSVLTLDTDLKITSWNRMCETLTGKTKESVMGKRWQEVDPAVGASKEFDRAFRHALRGRKSFVQADTESVEGEYMESHVVPLKDVLEQVTGILIIRHDVAHRQHAEQELKRLNLLLAQRNKELEAKNADLTSFSHAMSHDLKEPIRKIRIFTDMFIEHERNRISEEGASLFKRVLQSAHRAEEITDGIFAFAHIQNVKEPVTAVALTLSAKVVLHQLQQVIQGGEATVDFGELPQINGHSLLIQQLFKSILENALKFKSAEVSPFIKIRSGQTRAIEVSHENALPGIDYTWVSFEDNGKCFAPQYKERIFELFQRLHPANEYSGNGIGLSICRRIMEIHQGFITAQSEVGHGSVFTCYFPIKPGSCA